MVRALFHLSQRLIAEMAGLPEEAESAYQATLDDVAAGSAAPETWLRAAEAYAGFLARRGAKDEALAVLDKADEFATGRLPLVALREKINKGEKPVARSSRVRPMARAKCCSISAARSIAAAASLSCGSICSMRWR